MLKTQESAGVSHACRHSSGTSLNPVIGVRIAEIRRTFYGLLIPSEKDNFRTLKRLTEEFATRDGTDYVEPIAGYGARVHLASGCDLKAQAGGLDVIEGPVAGLADLETALPISSASLDGQITALFDEPTLRAGGGIAFGDLQFALAAAA